MNRIKSAVLIGVVAVTLSACGSSMDPEDLKAPADEWVGPAGGRVQLVENGVLLAELWVPAGALSTTQHIVIRELPQLSPAGTPRFAFEPDGLVFDAAAVVTVSFPTTEVAQDVYWAAPDVSGEWDLLPGAVSGGRVSARVERLAIGHRGPTCRAGTVCTSSAGNDCKVWAQSCFQGTRQCVETDALRPEGAVCRTGVCAYNVTRDDAFCAAQCNAVDIAIAAPVFAQYMENATVDPWTAGTIESGTYNLTELRVYAAVDPEIVETVQSVWVVEGTTVQGVTELVDGTERFTATWADDGGKLALALTCPQSRGATWDAYTVTTTEPVELHLQESNLGGTTKVRVYRKQ